MASISRLLIPLLLLPALAGCAPEASAPPPQATAGQDKQQYPGQGTVLDPQFKALHDAKQLGPKLNEDIGKNIDANVDPEGAQPPPQ